MMQPCKDSDPENVLLADAPLQFIPCMTVLWSETGVAEVSDNLLHSFFWL